MKKLVIIKITVIKVLYLYIFDDFCWKCWVLTFKVGFGVTWIPETLKFHINLKSNYSKLTLEYYVADASDKDYWNYIQGQPLAKIISNNYQKYKEHNKSLSRFECSKRSTSNIKSSENIRFWMISEKTEFIHLSQLA